VAYGFSPTHDNTVVTTLNTGPPTGVGTAGGASATRAVAPPPEVAAVEDRAGAVAADGAATLTSVAGLAVFAGAVLAIAVDVGAGVDTAEEALAPSRTVATLACSAAGGLLFFSVAAGVVGADCPDASSGTIEAPEAPEVVLSDGNSVLDVDPDGDEPVLVVPVLEVVVPAVVDVGPDGDESVVVVPVLEVFAPPEADTFASGSEAPPEGDVDPDDDDESVSAGALDASAGDEVEPVVSALATAELWVTAKPIPSATASTPTRPMYLP
jgi:hypothetical protein